MEPPAAPAPPSVVPPPDRYALAGWVVLWFVLLLYGAVTAPVPAVNEPHYLGKAKHFWNPAWCAGDLLLESANAHAVFYVVLGWMAHWLTLPQLAWTGRAVGYAVLARGWQRGHQAIGLATWQSAWSLLGFLSLASWGNLSGEWIVGGIEGKVFSYGFLLLALADWFEDRPYRSALWAGLAVSFHPIAGGWGVLAAMLAGVSGPRSGNRSWESMIKFFGVMFLAALPGLVPAVQLLFSQDSPRVRIDGTYLQVYYRLAHHLDPMIFSWRSWASYGVLLAIVLLFRRSLATQAAGRLWLRIVCWAGVFALAGLIAGWGPRPAKLMPYYLFRMNLLKFYPFRLFDVIVPLTVAIQVTQFVSQALPTWSIHKKAICGLLAGSLLLAVMAGGEWRKERLRKPTVFETPAWTDVCLWIKDHTPATALVQTPVRNQDFKWYAERAEYVSYKDMPQDNASLVEWNRRMNFLTRWYQEHQSDGGYTKDELRSLRAEIGVTHILTDRLGPFELPPCYTNDTFRVYDLTELNAP